MYRISSIIILALLFAAIHTAAAEYDMARHSSGGTQVIQDSTINNTPQPSGSIQTDLLEEKLTEYLSALDREPADVKCREADFIIGESIPAFLQFKDYGRRSRSHTYL